MIRHQYSYWLRLEGPLSDRKKAHECLDSHGLIPDYLQLTVSAEENVSTYEVPNGTTEETSFIHDTIGNMAMYLPSLLIFLDELDEEDHAIMRYSYWHGDKHAEALEDIGHELLRLKAEDTQKYKSEYIKKEIKRILVNQGQTNITAESEASVLASVYAAFREGADVNGPKSIAQEDRIYYRLSYECEENIRHRITEKMLSSRILILREFLYPQNPNVILYIGKGGLETIPEVIGNISEAVASNPGVIAFLEEEHQKPEMTKWHCWHNGWHAAIADDNGVLYQTELPLRDLLLEMCLKPDRYFGEADTLERICSTEELPRRSAKEQELVGGYHFVKVPSENHEGYNFDERIVVETNFLLEYAQEKGFQDLDDFFSRYNAEDVVDLKERAAEQEKSAFSFYEETGEVEFPTVIKGASLLAFADYLSKKLQDSGYEEASKYIDCLLDL